MAPRVLVAGIGNLFLGDDGFGPEVVRRLAAAPGRLPAGVRVTDYGIRGMHLAYDVLDGYDALVLVDALPENGRPGRVEVLQVAADDLGSEEFDAHGMNPAAALAGVLRMGGTLPPTYLVGVRTAAVADGIGLSPHAAAAVPEAIAAVHRLLARVLRPAPDSRTEPARIPEGRR
jgi:hydrogenase maturation protease